jgi:5-oxoprolinase (ATP-hydrolysing) subunit C
MLQLLEPGLLTTVQGVPYRGLRHLGMPLAGAADPVALALANWLVGNGPEAPALETAYAQVRLIALSDCVVAVQGAAREIEVDGATFCSSQALYLAKDQQLCLPAPSGGCRSYIAISGGVAVEPVLGATSTYVQAKLGGIDGSPLPGGAIVPTKSGRHFVSRTLPGQYRLRHGTDFLLRTTPTFESHWVEPSAMTGEQWRISHRADRMGLALEGACIKPLNADQVESSAVFPGTIQCPPSGQPFLLGADAQTTGGYPRIAQVIRADRHLIGQLRPGARVRFQRIEPAEAHRLYRSKIALVRQLQPEFRLD